MTPKMNFVCLFYLFIYLFGFSGFNPYSCHKGKDLYALNIKISGFRVEWWMLLLFSEVRSSIAFEPPPRSPLKPVAEPRQPLLDSGVELIHAIKGTDPEATRPQQPESLVKRYVLFFLVTLLCPKRTHRGFSSQSKKAFSYTSIRTLLDYIGYSY